MRRLLRRIVDFFAGLMAALKGGAHKIELYYSIHQGCVTPLATLMQAVTKTAIHFYAIIRLRAGDFTYDQHDIKIIAQDISNSQFYNLSAVVFRIKEGSGKLATKPLGCLMDEANGFNTTLHRVLNGNSNKFRALDQAIELGLD